MIAETSTFMVFGWVMPVYLFALALAYRWVYRSDQEAVNRSITTGLMIMIRLGIVFAFSAALLTDYLAFSPQLAAAILLFLVVWSTMANLQIPPGDGMVDILLWSILVMPLYLIKELVFGFPVQQDLFLRPEIDLHVPEELDHHLGSQAVVATPLRPVGTIIIDEQPRAARSTDGQFVDSGTCVIVRSIAGTTLVVETHCPADSNPQSD